jgi:hypothetical protein
MEFKVSGSGAESKTADIARQFNKPSGGRLMPLIIRAVEKCEEEVLSGLNLNPCDLWLYCTAMRALAEALGKGHGRRPARAVRPFNRGTRSYNDHGGRN